MCEKALTKEQIVDYAEMAVSDLNQITQEFLLNNKVCVVNGSKYELKTYIRHKLMLDNWLSSNRPICCDYFKKNVY